jgi:hypothetical protein
MKIVPAMGTTQKEYDRQFFVPVVTLIVVKLLTAIDGRDPQFFDKLLGRVVTSPIFVRF